MALRGDTWKCGLSAMSPWFWVRELNGRFCLNATEGYMVDRLDSCIESVTYPNKSEIICK